jgi:hypothetical protein
MIRAEKYGQRAVAVYEGLGASQKGSTSARLE